MILESNLFQLQHGRFRRVRQGEQLGKGSGHEVEP